MSKNVNSKIFIFFQRLLLHYILQEWLNISYLLAAKIDKPNGDSKIEHPPLEGLSIAFLCKEFPEPQLTLSYPGCCAMEHSVEHKASCQSRWEIPSQAKGWTHRA